MKVTYTISSGALPVTVQVVGTGISDTHSSYGQYTLYDIPDGTYTLLFTYSDGCDYSTQITICADCPDGYVVVGDACVLYEEESAIYTDPAFTVLRKYENSSYGSYGMLIFDNWNYNGTGTYERVLTTYWKNNWTTLGAMNRCCVWASTTYNNQDIAFTVCITVAETKTYYVGFGCDNWGKVKLNGQFVLEQDRVALRDMIVANGDSYDGWVDRIPYRYWYIYPLEITAGENVIEIFGHNEASVAAVGVQIYDNSSSEIIAATSDSDLSFVFDSLDIVGEDLPYEYSVANGYHGYRCPDGYALDACSETVRCVKKTVYDCGEAPELPTTTTTLAPTTTTTTTTLAPTTTTTTTASYVYNYTNTPQTGALGANSAWSYVAQDITSSSGDVGRVSMYFRNVGSPEYDITAYIYDGHIGDGVTVPAGGNTLLGTSLNVINYSEVGASFSLFEFYFNDITVSVDYSIVLSFTNRNNWDGSNKLDIGTGTAVVSGLNTSVYYTSTYDFRSSSSASITIDYTSLSTTTTTT